MGLVHCLVAFTAVNVMNFIPYINNFPDCNPIVIRIDFSIVLWFFCRNPCGVEYKNAKTPGIQ